MRVGAGDEHDRGYEDCQLPVDAEQPHRQAR